MTLLQENKNVVSSRAKPRDLTNPILTTLKYSDHFGFPLTLEEIYTRLVGARSSRPQMTTIIKQMLKAKIIAQTGDYYHLPGRKSLVARRLKRAKLSAPQLTHARALIPNLSFISGVFAIYLTGSLAMVNAGANADIDLMIITQNHRLWTTRLLLTIYTSLLGLRRTPHSTKNSGKLCLNLYLTPMSYELPNHKQTLYTAYELIQAIPLYDPHNTHPDLLSANSWISSYLPNVPTGSDPEGRAQPRRYNKRGGSDPIGILIEKIAYWFQKAYMKNKLTREYITPNSAFFHPHNPAPTV